MAAADNSDARDLLASVPGVPCAGEAPVFSEPWQAQAFALALALQRNGVFTWGEWASTLGDEIKKAVAGGDPDDGTTYYRHWLATLERLVAEKGLTSADTLGRYASAWGRAAERTPHGAPIELQARDFG